MHPQRRTALVSVLAAAALVALKLAAGVALRPADRGHQYGHGKAEHLAALAEATILVVASLGIAGLAVSHLVGASESGVEATWYAFAVVGAVIALDAARMTMSLRTARRFS